jgi:hypothetical protein
LDGGTIIFAPLPSPTARTSNTLGKPNFNNDFTNSNYSFSDNLSIENISDGDNDIEVTEDNYEIISYLSNPGIDLAVDYSTFSNFINFSSAEERLKIFKAKLDSIKSYEQSISSIIASNLTSSGLAGYSGSVSTYRNLIKKELEGFDHYERHLFFSSGSTAWPKESNTRPYTNLVSTEQEAITFFTNVSENAILYDSLNEGKLINTIPTFIREDLHNEKYLLFVNMIAQELDNVWIYTKGITDRYKADNRLNRGISKDLAKESVESLGYTLGPSNILEGTLFDLIVGRSYQTGSENVTEVVEALSGSNYAYLQTVPKINYEGEIYKRIYHNLPLLVKAKGTAKAYRALLNCFGIPPEVLNLKFGSYTNKTDDAVFGPDNLNTNISSTINQNADYTVIVNSPAVLSTQVSIVRSLKNVERSNKSVELGFGINDAFNNLIVSSSYTNNFKFDDAVGDPRNFKDGNSKYKPLSDTRATIISNENVVGSIRTTQDLVRTSKFFDNNTFNVFTNKISSKTSNTSGIIIKQDILDRKKHLLTSASFQETLYTGSYTVISTGSISSQDNYNTNLSYTADLVSSQGSYSKVIDSGEIGITGELKNSNLFLTDGELNKDNEVKKFNQPLISYNISAYRVDVDFSVGDFASTEPSGSVINILVDADVISYPGNNQIESTLTVLGISVHHQGLSRNNRISLRQADSIKFTINDGTTDYVFNNIVESRKEFSNYTYFGVRSYEIGDVVSGVGTPFSTANPNQKPSGGGFTQITGSNQESVNISPYFNLNFRLSDDNPLGGTVNLQRSNDSTFLLDKNTSLINPTNLDNILSGSGTFSSVPKSNFTISGLVNSRYEGTLETDNGVQGNSPVLSLVSAEAVITNKSNQADEIIANNRTTSTIVYFEPYVVTGSIISDTENQFVYNPLPSISGLDGLTNSSYMYTLSQNRFIKVEDKKIYLVDTNKVFTTNNLGLVVFQETGSV